MKPAAVESADFRDTADLLIAGGFRNVVESHSKVILKPNLIDELPHPITTSAELVFAVVSFIRDTWPGKEILIAEGCGAPGKTTHDVFRNLGYEKYAKRTGVHLVDLNEEACRKLSRKDAEFFAEIHLPEIVLEGALVSMPVLKAHSMAQVTLAMKNLVGLLPPSLYSQNGHWLKSHIHSDLHRGIVELNQYRRPDFCILDATIGMAQAHLWGPQCEPPVGVLACGDDPVALDALGTGLLGMEWRDIGHIRMADGLLGKAEDGEATLKELGRAT